MLLPRLQTPYPSKPRRFSPLQRLPPKIDRNSPGEAEAEAEVEVEVEAMAVADSRDQALSLLTAANNHADLAVKLSSLKQAKDILSSLDSSSAADLFPCLADLQRSPYSLVRKFLVDFNSMVKLTSGSKNYGCGLLGSRKPGSVGTKLLALKFLETYVLLLTFDNVDSEKFVEATRGSRWTFNVSWLSGGYPILDPVALTSDANRTLFVLLDILQSAGSLPGSVTITVINWL